MRKKEIIDIEKIKNTSKKIQTETTEKINNAIIAAFGLVVALAWNDAIQSLIKLIPIQKNNVLAKCFYAFFVTIILVFVTLFLNKIKEKVKDNK